MKRNRAKSEYSQEKTRGNGFAVAIFIALTIICAVFSVFCIYGTENAFFSANALWLSIVACVFLIAVCVLAIVLVYKNKQALHRTLLSAYIFVLFCLILIFILQRTGFFAVIKSAETLQQYLKTTGAWMPVAYIVLQYLQVVILPIPSNVSTAVGVALFGPYQTMLYSLGGIILGSFTAFFIGRKLGGKAVAWMVGEETMLKWQNKIKGKDNLFLTVMFLLPFFPDDVLCFIAGLSSMTTVYFSIMICICRLISVATTCIFLDLIPVTELWGLAVWAGIIVAIAVVFIIIYKKIDKIQAAIDRWVMSLKKKK